MHAHPSAIIPLLGSFLYSHAVQVALIVLASVVVDPRYFLQTESFHDPRDVLLPDVRIHIYDRLSLIADLDPSPRVVVKTLVAFRRLDMLPEEPVIVIIS